MQHGTSRLPQATTAEVVLPASRPSHHKPSSRKIRDLFGCCRVKAAPDAARVKKKRGGSAWESNPPGNPLVRPHNGFEDRAPHRRRRTPASVSQLAGIGAKPGVDRGNSGLAA